VNFAVPHPEEIPKKQGVAKPKLQERGKAHKGARRRTNAHVLRLAACYFYENLAAVPRFRFQPVLTEAVIDPVPWRVGGADELPALSSLGIGQLHSALPLINVVERDSERYWYPWTRPFAGVRDGVFACGPIA
jgi:hypothetical protein